MQTKMIMEDLIKAHGWNMNEQNYLEIKGSTYLLSVVPEYTFFVRGENGMIYRSLCPEGVMLNCAIMSPVTTPYGIEYNPVMYINILSEEEFYDFMITLVQTAIEEKPNLEKAV